MTDRYNGLIVALDGPIREDDLEATLNAIRCIKHVLRVTPVGVNSYSFDVAKAQIRDQYRKKIVELLEFTPEE